MRSAHVKNYQQSVKLKLCIIKVISLTVSRLIFLTPLPVLERQWSCNANRLSAMSEFS